MFGAILKESGKLDEMVSKVKKGPVKINTEQYQTVTAAALLNLVDSEITGKTTKAMVHLNPLWKNTCLEPRDPAAGLELFLI